MWASFHPMIAADSTALASGRSILSVAGASG
jgi:hypothetical protein